MRLTLRTITFLSVILIFTIITQTALSQEMCPALITQALTDLGANCEGMGRNNACYGFNRVDATFTQVQADDFFSQPSDRAELVTLQSIQTAPLEPDISQWGIAVMNLQANVPGTLPGQAVVFVLIGDAQIENAVPADEAQTAVVTPLDLVPTASINVRSAPSQNANIVGHVDASTTLQADGMSADQQWFRVVFNDSPAWVNRGIVTTTGDVSTLPVIDSDFRTPMQSFYFRSGIGTPECSEAPPTSLVIQGPQQVKVDLNVNGADIVVGSTVVLTQSTPFALELSVIDGGVLLEGGLFVPAGWTASVEIDEETGEITGAWGNLRPLTPEELDRLRALEGIPASLLNYAIDVPDGIPPTPTAVPQSNPQNAPPASATTESVPVVNCAPFRATAPTDGFPFGPTTFFWDAAPGATGYRVIIYDEFGAALTSLLVNAPNTSVSTDLSNPLFGSGFNFSWEVQALLGDQVVCSGFPISLLRESSTENNDTPGSDAQGNGDGGCDEPPLDNDNGGEGNEGGRQGAFVLYQSDPCPDPCIIPSSFMVFLQSNDPCEEFETFDESDAPTT